MGEGVGFCSTRETRYAFVNASRKCPACGKDAIIKGKAEYGGGWVCYKKKDGCGTKYDDGDAAIEGQKVGKVAVDNPVDSFNTVLKMAKKRALVDAVLTATAASDLFVQDLEDTPAPEAPVPAAGPSSWKALLEELKRACDGQDWTDWVKNQRQTVHGKQTLEKPVKDADLARWVRVLARVREDAHGELGLTDVQVQGLIASEFDGAMVDAPIPFGEAA